MYKKSRVREGFKNAFSGLVACVKNERSMKIHMAAAALVTAAGIFLKISTAEWLICLVFFAVVSGMEALNTALEAVVDICSPQYHEKAKLAKDAAAAAVLLCAAFAAIAGGVIFLPKLIRLIF